MRMGQHLPETHCNCLLQCLSTKLLYQGYCDFLRMSHRTILPLTHGLHAPD